MAMPRPAKPAPTITTDAFFTVTRLVLAALRRLDLAAVAFFLAVVLRFTAAFFAAGLAAVLRVATFFFFAAGAGAVVS
ncbi:hypothetical protein GCM10007426_38510 [Alloalcanivorax dieselolei]|nr:hypothetical protein GCM10007426_38510 [Alloalcanivorax dieselolei]